MLFLLLKMLRMSSDRLKRAKRRNTPGLPVQGGMPARAVHGGQGEGKKAETTCRYQAARRHRGRHVLRQGASGKGAARGRKRAPYAAARDRKAGALRHRCSHKGPSPEKRILLMRMVQHGHAVAQFFADGGEHGLVVRAGEADGVALANAPASWRGPRPACRDSRRRRRSR